MLISNIFAILLTLVIIIPVAFVLVQVDKDKTDKDARGDLQLNDTKCNTGGTIPPAVIENASKRELMEIIDKAERGHINDLSHTDFYRLKKKLDAVGVKRRGC